MDGNFLITFSLVLVNLVNHEVDQALVAADEPYQGVSSWLSMAEAIARYPASFGCMLGPYGLGAHIHVSSQA